MKPLRSKPRQPHESVLTREVVVPWLKAQGYTIVVKMHGNRYSKKGQPDLYAFRRAGHHCQPGKAPCESPMLDEHHWFEVKKPDGKLEASQAKLFAEWEAQGLVVRVLCVRKDRDHPEGRVTRHEWHSWPVKPAKKEKLV